MQQYPYYQQPQQSVNNSNGGIMPLLIIAGLIFGAWWFFNNQDDSNNHDDENHDVDVETSEIWEAVATLIEEGDPQDTHELSALILQLEENGILTRGDVEEFNDAFPDIAHEFRELSDNDAETIRDELM